MPSAQAREILVPSMLVDAAVAREQREFLLLYGDASILLIEIPPGDGEIEQGLGALEPERGALPFRTEVASFPRVRVAAPRGGRTGDPIELARLLQGKQHFAFALRKRANSHALSADRISVGRARNKDLVLRHPSVSKFHAWFENGSDGAVFVADADSKNQTRVNSTVIEPRTKTLVVPGDVVRFGSVDCLLCTASTFWACLRSPAPRTATLASVRPRPVSNRPLETD